MILRMLVLAFLSSMSLALSVMASSCLDTVRGDVSWYVAGLYDSIPVSEVFENQDLKILHHRNVFESTRSKDAYRTGIEGSNWVRGHVERTVTRRPDGQFELLLESSRFLNDAGTKKIKGFVVDERLAELVPGRGTPTLLLATLQMLKLSGVPEGGLAKISTSEIHNLKTAQFLAKQSSIARWIERNPETDEIPGALIAKVIMGSQSGKHIRDLAVQTGHEIVRVRVTAAKAYGEVSGELLPNNFKIEVLLKPRS